MLETTFRNDAGLRLFGIGSVDRYNAGTEGCITDGRILPSLFDGIPRA